LIQSQMYIMVIKKIPKKEWLLDADSVIF
jgi:hypothetical protein